VDPYPDPPKRDVLYGTEEDGPWELDERTGAKNIKYVRVLLRLMRFGPRAMLWRLDGVEASQLIGDSSVDHLFP
jgi:hypothetical protein